MVGSFAFDPLTAPAIISESGAGPTTALEFLSVAFLDPANTVMQTFDTVLGVMSESPFLAFNFDTTTNALSESSMSEAGPLPPACNSLAVELVVSCG